MTNFLTVRFLALAPLLVGSVLVVSLAAGCSGGTVSRTKVTPGHAEVTQESKTKTPTIAHENRTIEHLSPEGVVQSRETVKRVETGGTTVETKASGVAHGAGVDTTADDIAQKFTGSPPELVLPDGSQAKGGGAESKTDAKTVIPASLWSNPMLWVGIFCVCGAAVAVYFRLRRAAAISGGVGLALIVAALFPGFLLFIVAGILAVLVGVYIYAERRGEGGTEALRAVVAGIASLPPDTQANVKREIAKHADEADRAAIRTVKLKDHLQ